MEVFYTEEADQDLTGIYNYILKDGEDIARSYIQRIRERIKVLEDFPNFGKWHRKYKYILAEKHKVFFCLQRMR